LPKTTRARLVKLLDAEWARIIKRGGKCAKSGSTGNLHAAHIFSRRSMSTRWDLDNGIPLGFFWHLRWAHQEPIKFHDFVKEYLGEEKLEQLRQRNAKVKKWTIDEMEDLLSQFKKIK